MGHELDGNAVPNKMWGEKQVFQERECGRMGLGFKKKKKKKKGDGVILPSLVAVVETSCLKTTEEIEG
jgi:hypothetical protein